MAAWWTNLVDRIWEGLIPEDPLARSRPKAPPDVVAAIDRAKQDWESAQAYFDNVTDPDLIDHAIFAIEAAERKYIYLLKRAEELGYEVPQDDLKRLNQGSPP